MVRRPFWMKGGLWGARCLMEMRFRVKEAASDALGSREPL